MWCIKVSNPVILEQEIRAAVERYSFGMENPRKADTVAWANQTQRIGADAKWAISWIVKGYPEVPEWLKRLPEGCAELWNLDPDRQI